MKLIEQKVENISQTDFSYKGAMRFAERVGRICYDSTDKITEDSWKGFNGRLSKNEHCFDKNVEILTEHGWIPFSKYNGEKVATINKDLTFNGFETPSDIIKYDYEGEFYTYPTLGLKMTAGHQLYGVWENDGKLEFDISKLEKHSCDEKSTQGRKYTTYGTRRFICPTSTQKPQNSNPYWELLGFWLGDGTHKNYTKRSNKLIFHLTKENKIKYLYDLCKALNFSIKKEKYNFYSVAADFRIGVVSNNKYYKDRQKFIDDFYDNPEICCSIITGLLKADGAIYSDGTIRFYTTSGFIKEWLLRVGVICGFEFNLQERVDSRGVRKCYRFSVSKKNFHSICASPKSLPVITKEKETVYCVSVSTGLIAVRGINGRVSIIGNCSPFGHSTLHIKTPIYSDIYQLLKNECFSPNGSGLRMNFFNNTRDGFSYWTISMRVFIEKFNEEQQKLIMQYIDETPSEFYTKRNSVLCTTSIGVTRELNRHKWNLDIMEKSTRYTKCFNVIKPYWYDNKDAVVQEKYRNSCKEHFKEYNDLLSSGLKKQEARGVLPIDAVSEVIYTAFDYQWQDVFKKRLVSGAHPDCKRLVKLIKESE